MVLDTIQTKILDDEDKELKILIQKDEIMTQFIDNIMANLHCLGEEVNPSIPLLLGFW